MTVQVYANNMQTNPYAIYNLSVMVDGVEVLTDQEGYIQNMDEWSAGFATAAGQSVGGDSADEGGALRVPTLAYST
jgi:tRNA 2-thiouridine synthesizing protein E